MVEVTESDRRAVRAFQKASARYIHRVITDVSFGSALGEQQDDTHPIYQAFATHRIEAAKAERDRIVAWLRDDARLTEIEARRILGNLTTLTQADTDDWAKLILMKHGIADALEKRP